MQSESYLTPPEAAPKFPGCPASTTVWRWARHGRKCRDGSHVFLEHVVVGGKIFIPERAIETFIQAVTAANALRKATRQPVVAPPQTDRARVDLTALKRWRLV